MPENQHQLQDTLAARVAAGAARGHDVTFVSGDVHVTVPWAEVHDEAEVLEHAVSDRFIARIDAAMGHPDRDPHGDPIPDPEGRVTESVTVPLADAAVGDRLFVDRVSDRDGALLRYLEDHGIIPGAVIEVGERPYPDMASLSVVGEAGPTEVQLSAPSLGAVLCRAAE